ncbi:MAG TPA: NAD(P)/FAD-dependent oxidoreductase [Burkholderiales bacterium]|nr:NAD(P)/FAD-dependent oxidoreductase [Burkholderiales bacterium]
MSDFHVVVIGCGFGGLEATRVLAGKRGVRVTLIDRCNHHLFQPLLYQVATAGLASTSIAAPIRYMFRNDKNVTVLMGEVARIDAAARRVVFDDGWETGYDALILAAGSTHSYFGHDDWAQHAPGLKTLDDALKMRRELLLAFEEAERSDSDAERRLLTHFVVVGAGPTGVEMAGTLAEIARNTLAGEFRHFNPVEARVTLLDGGDRVLPAFPGELSEKALLQLQRLGVEVRLKARVTSIDAEGVDIEGPQGRERLDSRTVIWAAGVKAVPLTATLGVPVDRGGRIPVNADLSVPGHPEVFAVGDLAAAQSRAQPVPGVSPAAKQMGRCAARNILARLAGKPTREFVYIDYGSLATIGRKSAVALLGPVKLWGLPAWLLWLFAHIYFLIGFRNRIVVMLDWAWAYFSFARYARIILGRHEAP